MPGPIQTLARYRIDRADGFAACGPEKLVVIVLKANESAEYSVAVSKADAMLIGLALQAAATDVASG